MESIFMPNVELQHYNNSNYAPGGTIKRLLWYGTNWLFFATLLPFPSSLKCKLLRLFGASVGKRVVIKPNVNIKYPWFLSIGSDVWVGEGAWIDNLATVTIENNVVISQDAYLLTGSHDYRRRTFDLITQPITLHEGSWVGAKATICPGVTLHEYAVVSVGSIATQSCEAYGIYQGNPATLKRQRTFLSEQGQ